MNSQAIWSTLSMAPQLADGHFARWLRDAMGERRRTLDSRRHELAFGCIVAGWVGVLIQARRIEKSQDRAAYLAERREHTLALLERLAAEVEAGTRRADQRVLIQQARAAICRSVDKP